MTNGVASGSAFTRSVVVRAERALASGDLRRAERLLAAATARLSNLPLPEQVQALQLQAIVLIELAEHVAAEGVLRQVLDLLESAEAPIDDGPERLTETLTALGTVLRLQARYQWADRVLRDAAAAAADPTVSPQARLAVLNASAVVCKDTGSFEQAESLYQEVLDGFTELDGPSCDAVASTCHNLAGLSHARGRYVEAEPWARRALGIRLRSHPPDDPSVLADQVVLAAVLVGQGRESEAEPLYAAALSAYERLHGPGHYEVAVCHNGLAACRVAADDAEGALQHLREALQIKRAVLGGTHPEIGVLLNNMGVALRSLRRDAEAAAAQREAIPLLEAALPADHPVLLTCRDNLADARTEPTGPTTEEEAEPTQEPP
jgi:tetratricopeptide (TPR) repeat protein